MSTKLAKLIIGLMRFYQSQKDMTGFDQNILMGFIKCNSLKNF